MATDATGIPTSLGIPKFNTNVDAPSGQGGNAQMDAIDLLFRSRTTVAGTAIWLNKLLAADANPSVQMLGSGQLSWGPGGAAALDTNLYRSSAGVLKTDGGLVVGGNSFSILNTTQGKTYRFLSQVPGALYLDDGAAGSVDFNLTSLGKLQFGYTLGAVNSGQFGPTVGPGSSPGLILGTDTNLYRGAASLLRTDGALAFTAQASAPLRGEQVAANLVLQNKLLAGDANNAFQIGGDGTTKWGPGAATAPDVTLARAGVRELRLTSDTAAAAYLSLTGELTARYGVAGSTIIGLVGTGGTAGIQFQGDALATVYRSAAGVTKTDGVFQGDLKTLAASLLTARTGGTAAALPAAPVKYLALYDETGARVYVPAYS